MNFEVGDIVTFGDRIGVIDHFCLDSAYVFFYEEDEYLLIMPNDQGGLKLYCESHDFHLGDRVYFWDDRKCRHVGIIDRLGKKMPKCTVFGDDGLRLVREVRKIVHVQLSVAEEKKESYVKRWEFL